MKSAQRHKNDCSSLTHYIVSSDLLKFLVILYFFLELLDCKKRNERT